MFSQDLKSRWYSGYLTVQSFPKEHQEFAAALLLFFDEVIHLPIRISDPMAGEIRLQWWRDVITQRLEEARSHPVGAAFFALQGIDETLLLPILENISPLFYQNSATDWNEFEAQAAYTYGTLFQILGFRLNGQKLPTSFSDAAGHGAVAAKCGYLLKHHAFLKAHGRGLVPDSVEGDALSLLKEKGQKHYVLFRAANIPNGLRPALSLLAPVPLEMQMKDLSPLKIWWAHFRF